MSTFHCSTFKDDGYRDGVAGKVPAYNWRKDDPLPDSIVAQEYLDGYQQGILTLLGEKMALVAALERLLHPMADDDDITHAQEVLRSLKGE